MLGFLFFDPLFMLLSIPGLLLSLWAQARVKSAYHRWGRVGISSGLSGAESAARMLEAAGIIDVTIEETGGVLSDHYDPRSRTLRLSPDVFRGRSISAVGIAAHEAGHALQHATNYTPMYLRQAIVPICSIGSNLGVWAVMIGLMINMTGLAWLGVAAFATMVVFQLVTLPVEVNASNRAKAAILEYGLARPGEETDGIRQILNAAAWTYFAAMVSSVMQLLYYVILVSGRSRDD